MPWIWSAEMRNQLRHGPKLHHWNLQPHYLQSFILEKYELEVFWLTEHSSSFIIMTSNALEGDFLGFFMYYIQHCFVWHPSDSICLRQNKKKKKFFFYEIQKWTSANIPKIE